MDISYRTGLSMGTILAPFFLGFITLVLFLWYSSRKQSYWKNIGIPYAKPYPIFGSILGMMLKPFQEAELDRYKKYGRLYGHYEGNRALLSVGDPEILRSILVKDFHAFTGRRRFLIGDKIFDNILSNLHGEEWKRVRSIVTPTFTTGKIKRLMRVIEDCSKTLVQNFKKATRKEKAIEVKAIYGAFTMDVIASSAFSTKIDSHNDPNNEFVVNARAIFNFSFNWRVALFYLMPGVTKFFGISVLPPKSLKFFTDVTVQIIDEWKRTGERRNDFLQLLMDTAKELSEEVKLDPNEKDDIVENYGKDENNEIFKPAALTKKSLSQEELVAQCVIFFLAGYDSTATTLSFVSYLLALNPDVQEKVINELDNVLRGSNGELKYEAIQSMKYLDNVISETIRLYPPGSRLERVADEDYKLGDTGLTIPKGMIVTIPVYAMHRDPKFFPNPEKFDPDRFTLEERSKREQYSYLPFGAGPRNCIGMRFALMVMKVCLVHVLSNFRFKKCPQTKVAVDWFLGPGPLKPRSITLCLEARKDTA